MLRRGIALSVGALLWLSVLAPAIANAASAADTLYVDNIGGSNCSDPHRQPGHAVLHGPGRGRRGQSRSDGPGRRHLYRSGRHFPLRHGDRTHHLRRHGHQQQPADADLPANLDLRPGDRGDRRGQRGHQEVRYQRVRDQQEPGHQRLVPDHRRQQQPERRIRISGQCGDHRRFQLGDVQPQSLRRVRCLASGPARCAGRRWQQERHDHHERFRGQRPYPGLWRVRHRGDLEHPARTVRCRRRRRRRIDRCHGGEQRDRLHPGRELQRRKYVSRLDRDRTAGRRDFSARRDRGLQPGAAGSPDRHRLRLGRHELRLRRRAGLGDRAGCARHQRGPQVLAARGLPAGGIAGDRLGQRGRTRRAEHRCRRQPARRRPADGQHRRRHAELRRPGRVRGAGPGRYRQPQRERDPGTGRRQRAPHRFDHRYLVRADHVHRRLRRWHRRAQRRLFLGGPRLHRDRHVPDHRDADERGAAPGLAADFAGHHRAARWSAEPGAGDDAVRRARAHAQCRQRRRPVEPEQ